MLRVALTDGSEVEEESFLPCSVWLCWQSSSWLVCQPCFALSLAIAGAWRESCSFCSDRGLNLRQSANHWGESRNHWLCCEVPAWYLMACL